MISTHAPAGGATSRRRFMGLSVFISTHAPAGGATRRHDGLHRAGMHFYSRPCGRGDLTSGDSDEDAVLFLLTPLREGRP